LTEERRIKVDGLELDHDVAAQLHVVEEQIAVELVAAEL
jgi:trans-2-enoyl-CoA reductase